MKKIVTFDVFDTCIVRATGNPNTIFKLLANNVIQCHESLSDIADFVKIRINGEKAARAKEKNEVTLREIYSECDFSSISQYSKDVILSKELELEENCLVPVKFMLEKVNRYRNKGFEIGYITDIYLPESFIRGVLSNFGFFVEGDLLLVSSKYRKTKNTGLLFKELNSIYSPFKIWHHYGDNLKSDVIRSLQNGAIPHRVRHNVSGAEEIKKQAYSPQLLQQLLVSTSISRALRLKNPRSMRYQFAVDVIAPIYVPYVWHVLESAKRRKINKLYFFARDGYIFYKIAQCFSLYFSDISLHYIYVSRKSIYYPSLININEDNILEYIGKKETNIEVILAKLLISCDNLPVDDFSALKKQASAKEVIGYIFSHRGMLDVVMQKQKEQQQLFLAYLKQEGLATNIGKCAIVDLRGTRKSQNCINLLLRENKCNEVFGYYYEVEDGRSNPTSSDSYEANIFREDFVANELLEPLHTSTALFEQYFSVNNQRRTSYYAKDGNSVIPIFEREDKSAMAQELAEINIEACLDYAKYYGHTFPAYSSHVSSIHLCKFLQDLAFPDRALLRLFDGLVVSENEFDIKVYLKKLTIRELFKHHNILWFKGSILLTFGSWLNGFFFIKKKLHSMI